MAAKLKHRWSVGHNYLAGITAGDWWRLLRDTRFAVDPPYWHRAAVVSALSVINSVHRWREQRRWHTAIAQTEITEPPLFILGHWRSGTTHLHNLIAQDSAQFAYANTYQVVSPHTFLTTEEFNSRWFAGLIPNKRPMDNMALGFQTPQEDEFGPALITGLSLYYGMSFPRSMERYRRYLSFREVPRAEVEQWQAGFLWFLKKLTLKYRRALVLKSPPHTARIRLLLEMFPNARFVHIHRHPYDVYRSFRHFHDTATWYTYLQRPDVEAIPQQILSGYTALYDAFFADLPLIPAGQFHELRYDDLERDPLEQVRATYTALGLSGFDSFQPRLERYVASLGKYEKNRFDDLSEPLRAQIAREWRRSFERWGYTV